MGLPNPPEWDMNSVPKKVSPRLKKTLSPAAQGCTIYFADGFGIKNTMVPLAAPSLPALAT